MFQSVLFEAILVIVSILITILLWRRRKLRNMPPGPRGWPVVGSLLSLSKDQPFVDMMKLGKAYGGRGNIVTLQLGSTTVVVLNSYEAIKEALVIKGEYFSSRPGIPLFTAAAKRKGIVSTPYSQAWKEQRTFALKTLRSFGMGKRSLEGKISEELSFLFEKIARLKGQPSNIYNLLNASVSNIICSIVKGERFECEDPQFELLLRCLKDTFEASANSAVVNFFPILGYIPFLNTNLKVIRDSGNSFIDYFLPIIESHKKDFQEDDVRDFIDAYLIEVDKTKQNPHSSFQDKLNFPRVIIDLFAAGTETLSTSLYWTILYLAVYPDIQTHIQQELDKVVGRNRLPTLEDQNRLTFTRASIREVQRLASILPLAAPHSTTEQIQLMGYTIPQNTQIFANIWAVHHDPSIWDEPHSFKPDRFIDDSGNLTKPIEYIPFSLGRRECIGEQLATMELYLFTTSLFHRYTFRLPKGTSPPLKGKNGLSLSPYPYQVVVKER